MTPDATQPSADLRLPGLPGSRLAHLDGGTAAAVASTERGLLEVTLTAADGRPGSRLEVDLVDAVGYWHPPAAGTHPLPRTGPAAP